MTRHPSVDAVLSWDTAGGTSYTAIAQVRDITGPALSRDSTDVSDRSITDYYREFLPGLVDPGELTFSLTWDPNDTEHAQTSGLLNDFENEGCTLPAWQLVLDICGGTATWTWDGFLTGFTPNVPISEALTADVTVKISGKPTLDVT